MQDTHSLKTQTHTHSNMGGRLTVSDGFGVKAGGRPLEADALPNSVAGYTGPCDTLSKPQGAYDGWTALTTPKPGQERRPPRPNM